MLYVILTILIILLIYLIIKLIFMKKSIKEIENNLKGILEQDTNSLISISSSDKNIKSFAEDLNVELKKLRSKEIEYENGNQELRKSITNISHDLRTPLTAIQGYLDLLKEEELNDKQNKYVNIIDNKSKELISLTEQLFDFSKSLDLENKLHKENCLINSILEETIASYYNLFKEKCIKPNIKICQEKIYRQVDKNMLIRVFENLISNIIKYSDGDCNIILQSDGKIEFSNKASKLDVTTVKKIFDRYYTLENAQRYSGVGLAIAKQLVEINGGKIQADYLSGRLRLEVILFSNLQKTVSLNQ